MGKFLTPKQKQVLDYLLEYRQKRGYAPSQQEIARYFGFSSLGTVQHYLKQLEELGYLQKEWNARRGLSLGSAPSLPAAQKENQEEASIRNLPLLGRVAAGKPIEAIRTQERVEVPSSLLKRSGEHFVLQVKGDSMIEDGILEGDYVVIRKQNSAENGETVVALINQEATIKRYYRQKGRVELHPANPSYAPIRVEPEQEFKIEGILSGLIRKIGK